MRMTLLLLFLFDPLTGIHFGWLLYFIAVNGVLIYYLLPFWWPSNSNNNLWHVTLWQYKINKLIKCVCVGTSTCGYHATSTISSWCDRGETQSKVKQVCFHAPQVWTHMNIAYVGGRARSRRCCWYSQATSRDYWGLLLLLLELL